MFWSYSNQEHNSQARLESWSSGFPKVKACSLVAACGMCSLCNPKWARLVAHLSIENGKERGATFQRPTFNIMRSHVCAWQFRKTPNKTRYESLFCSVLFCSELDGWTHSDSKKCSARKVYYVFVNQNTDAWILVMTYNGPAQFQPWYPGLIPTHESSHCAIWDQ